MRRSSAASSRARGLSLAELLVSAFLFSFVLTGVVKVVIEGLRYFTVQSIALEVQQQSLLAMKSVSQELSDAHLSSFKVYTTPSGIIFGSPRNADGKVTVLLGSVVWHKFVCYYIGNQSGTSVLMRKQRVFTLPAMAPPPIPAALTPAVFAGDPSQGRILARHMKSIKATLTNPTKVTIQADYGQGSFTMKLETQIHLGEEAP